MVQGPPGCGKTFVGVRVAQLLLSMTRAGAQPGYMNDDNMELEFMPDNTSSQPHAGPILVVTYKNVALDDFLR